jgi:hypothetical protein
VIWLNEEKGYLSDWVTQQWVRLTGRKMRLAEHPWLNGPVGNTQIIGKDFFAQYARTHALELAEDGPRGLLQSFNALAGEQCDPHIVAREVHDFYERTSEYELDAWAEWHGFFKPFGTALAVLFSRRLQQLSIPLSALDSSRGMSSRVLQMRDSQSGELAQTAWVRELHATRNVIYAGSYSISMVPGYGGPCVKVVFPLPNGNAIVFMKPESHSDGSFSITSAGNGFGDPGFYFVVHGQNGTAWARYVAAMTEKITVYPDTAGSSRADHILWFFGKEFLRLHYRMRVSMEIPVEY